MLIDSNARHIVYSMITHVSFDGRDWQIEKGINNDYGFWSPRLKRCALTNQNNTTLFEFSILSLFYPNLWNYFNNDLFLIELDGEKDVAFISARQNQTQSHTPENKG